MVNEKVIVVSTLNGAKGETGERGPRGLTGPQGPQGVPGPEYDDTELREEIERLDNTKMEYYKVTIENGHFEHEGTVLTYQDLKDKFDDDSIFLYLVEDNLIFIPSIDVPNSAIAFSTAWSRKESIGDDEYEQPYIQRVMINNQNDIHYSQIGMQNNEMIITTKQDVDELEEIYQPFCYPSVGALKQIEDDLKAEQSRLSESIAEISNNTYPFIGSVENALFDASSSPWRKIPSSNYLLQNKVVTIPKGIKFSADDGYVFRFYKDFDNGVPSNMTPDYWVSEYTAGVDFEAMIIVKKTNSSVISTNEFTKGFHASMTSFDMLNDVEKKLNGKLNGKHNIDSPMSSSLIALINGSAFIGDAGRIGVGFPSRACTDVIAVANKMAYLTIKEGYECVLFANNEGGNHSFTQLNGWSEGVINLLDFNYEYFALTIRNKSNTSLVGVDVSNIVALVNYEGFADYLTESDIKNWKNKTIVWFGTSIPEGMATIDGVRYSYPTYVGRLLGANVYNEALGSSCARYGNSYNTATSDVYGLSKIAWQNVFLSMGATLAEKEDFISNYDTYKYIIGGDFEGASGDGTGTGKPNTLNDSWKNKIRNASFENKLLPYLDGRKPMPDLFVFDHGNNDNFGYTGETEEQFDTVPSTDDRGTFIGAMNFYIRKILSANPRAKIVIISHYENQLPNKVRVPIAQQKIADYWSIPYFKLYEKLGWSQKILNNGKTVLNNILPDNLHPHSDSTGYAIKTIAENCAEFINGLH